MPRAVSVQVNSVSVVPGCADADSNTAVIARDYIIIRLIAEHGFHVKKVIVNASVNAQLGRKT
jgi:hypothetical protein